MTSQDHQRLQEKLSELQKLKKLQEEAYELINFPSTVAKTGDGSLLESIIAMILEKESQIIHLKADTMETVRDQREAKRQKVISDLPLCEIDFYTAFREAKEEKGLLNSAYSYPMAEGSNVKSLLIRECYTRIADLLIERDSSAILTGTAGIGKTCFLFYLLYRLIKLNKKVIFQFHGDYIFYHGNQDVRFIRKIQSLPREFYDGNIWCLFDGSHMDATNLATFPVSRCKLFVATSPRRNLMNDFKKRATKIFFMPVWEKEEIAKIARFYPESTDWESRYELLGGIPRYVCQHTDEPCEEIIEMAVSHCDIDKCFKGINRESDGSDNATYAHRLIHMRSEYPYTKCTMSYASDYVMDEIFSQKRKEARRKMQALLESCQKPYNKWISSLLGRVFEDYVLEVFAKGGSFQVRKLLNPNNSATPPAEEPDVLIKASRPISVAGISRGQLPDVLHVPSSTNYPAIDAWIPSCGVFQMTVSLDHGIAQPGKLISDMESIGCT
jgi:hypothetical protein